MNNRKVIDISYHRAPEGQVVCPQSEQECQKMGCCCLGACPAFQMYLKGTQEKSTNTLGLSAFCLSQKQKYKGSQHIQACQYLTILCTEHKSRVAEGVGQPSSLPHVICFSSLWDEGLANNGHYCKCPLESNTSSHQNLPAETSRENAREAQQEDSFSEDSHFCLLFIRTL